MSKEYGCAIYRQTPSNSTDLAYQVEVARYRTVSRRAGAALSQSRKSLTLPSMNPDSDHESYDNKSITSNFCIHSSLPII